MRRDRRRDRSHAGPGAGWGADALRFDPASQCSKAGQLGLCREAQRQACAASTAKACYPCPVRPRRTEPWLQHQLAPVFLQTDILAPSSRQKQEHKRNLFIVHYELRQLSLEARTATQPPAAEASPLESTSSWCLG